MDGKLPKSSRNKSQWMESSRKKKRIDCKKQGSGDVGRKIFFSTINKNSINNLILKKL